ncbi:hypothetical protein MW871_16200 [Flavobacterium sp. I-SCBP12n]|uniref:RES domain-containing protein n=1 Tax=Flavobacterium pygoscelis TaxID=2893176 RepID=A0A9X1XUC8_9FLAO|nr:hypothetical protein [Flavobacterium pygoscelis]MCK8143434.1 hypothetical protein [Flavobacterium pygoscelis]
MKIENLPFYILKKFISTKLKTIDTIFIEKALKEIKAMPITIAKMNSGHYVDRIRPHSEDFRAKKIQELSYIKEKSILDVKRINNEYGRANIPGESMFYGSLMTAEIQQNRATAFMETSEMFYKPEITEEYFTLSRWDIIEDFQVYEVVFQEDLKQLTESVLSNKETQMEFMKEITLSNEELLNDAKEKLSFFSNEFAKEVKKEDNELYRISAIFTNIFLSHPKSKNIVWGIVYPSVKSNYLGLNVAILPEGTDKFLKFRRADVMKAVRQKDGSILIEKSVASAENLDGNGNLIWIENRNGL